jgi:hypothetical protein
MAITDWVEGATDTWLLDASGARRVVAHGRPAEFLDADHVIVTRKDGVFRVDTTTKARTLIPGLADATMVSARSGLLVGSAGTPGGASEDDRSGVFDARSGAPALGLPAGYVWTFSPGGRYLAGYRAIKTTTGHCCR